MATGRTKAIFTKERENIFLQDMAKARSEQDVEKAVEGTINAMVKEGFGALYGTNAELTFPHNTDGFLRVRPPGDSLFALEGEAALGEGAVNMGELRLLIEVKRAMNLQEPHDRAVVLIQALCYLQRFQEAGDALPQGVVVADQSSIFFCHSKFLEPYLNQEHDWNVAPSSAHRRLPQLLASLEEDPNLTLHVERFDSPGFSMGEFITRVALEAQLSKVKSVEVDDKLSMEKAWLEYLNGPFGGVLTDPVLQVSLWIRLILGDPGVKLHDKFKNALSISSRDKKGNIVETRFPTKANQPFSANAHIAYTTKYKLGGYTKAENRNLTAMADVLIEETKRRFHGDYWTPTLWVREAHSMIEGQLGDDWREKYVVWDPAAGTKNLTRDYRFKELYSSTLHAEELAMAEEYNEEGTAFQYDFLNDDIRLHALSQGLFDKKPGEMSPEEKSVFLEEQRGNWKLPDGLLEALVYNKPILFLMNPPYGSNGNRGGGDRKTGIALTEINKMMVQDGFAGHAAQELYAQFIYRCQQLALAFGYEGDFNIFLFAANTYLTSPHFSRFGENLRAHYRHLGGFMLNAGEFQGTTSTWAINFAGWSLAQGGTEAMVPFSVRESATGESGEPLVREIARWNAVAVDKENTISTLIPSPRGATLTKGTYPTTKNGFQASTGQNRVNMKAGAFGYAHNHGNTVQFSEKYIGMYSMGFNGANGVPVDGGNLIEASTVFAIRTAIYKRVEGGKMLWVRGKDNLPAPSKEFQESDAWESLTTDCLVYSLFARGSNQTALRDYEYGTEADGSSKLWRVENQFYWGSREHIQELAREHHAEEILEDLEGDKGERYVHEYLEEREASPQAQLLLDKANAILDASFKHRVPFYYGSPLYCTIAWDMGWLQLQRMCFGREALPAAKADKELQALYGEFKVARDALGEKIATRYSEDTGF